jgi:hypothetical protein
VVVKVDITEVATRASFALESSAAVADEERFAEKQLQHSLIKASKSDLHQYELTQALVPATWQGT